MRFIHNRKMDKCQLLPEEAETHRDVLTRDLGAWQVIPDVPVPMVPARDSTHHPDVRLEKVLPDVQPARMSKGKTVVGVWQIASLGAGDRASESLLEIRNTLPLFVVIQIRGGA